MIQTQKQIYNRMAESEKNPLVAKAQLKCCGTTLRELSINEYPQTSINCSSIVKKSGSKFFHKERLKSTRKHSKLLLQEVVLQSAASQSPQSPVKTLCFTYILFFFMCVLPYVVML